MSETLSIETFEHLVSLAALELEPEQAAYLRRELNAQLDAIRELEAIPLDESVEITSHGVPFDEASTPPLREDVWQPHPNPDEILAGALQSEDRYFVVPDIPHTTLE